MTTGAADLPARWLRTTPFADFTVPGLLLLSVACATLVAGFAVFARLRRSRAIAFAGGYALLGWMMGQIILIGSVSWLQPLTMVAAIALLLLSWALPIPSEDPAH